MGQAIDFPRKFSLAKNSDGQTVWMGHSGRRKAAASEAGKPAARAC
jgi:hypothetical protein